MALSAYSLRLFLYLVSSPLVAFSPTLLLCTGRQFEGEEELRLPYG